MPDSGIAEPGLRDQRGRDIQSVTRCGEILRLLAVEGTVRAADVAAALGLQKSTAHRYLASMAATGLLERVDGGGFEPGPIAVHLGAVAMRRSRVLDVAAPYLTSLAHQTHETAVLSLWGGRGAVVARVAEDDERFAVVSVREGRCLPADSAQTQIFLAFLGDEQLVDEVLQSVPPHERPDLRREIARVAETGVGMHSNVVQGIHAISAPVFDTRGSIAAAVAVVGTSDALVAGPDAQIARALRAMAERISAQLGHTAGMARDQPAQRERGNRS